MDLGIIGRNEELIKKLIGKHKPKKLFFIVEKEKVASIIPVRNKISLSFKLPSEIVWEARGDVIFSLNHSPFSFEIASQCILKGIPFFYFDGSEFRALPVVKGGLSSMFSDIQLAILKALKNPLSFEELSEKVNIPSPHLYYYLYGRNSLKGLVNLGLVEMKGGKYKITKLGERIIKGGEQ